MVYKFNSEGLEEKDATNVEFSHTEGRLRIISSSYEDEMMVNFHHLEFEDIDDLIIALTNIRQEIVAYRESVAR